LHTTRLHSCVIIPEPLPDNHTSLYVTHTPPRSTLFPYTTLFRSWRNNAKTKRLRRVHSLTIRSNASVSGHAMNTIPVSRMRSGRDRKSTRLNSSHQIISYAVLCLNTKRLGPPGLALSLRQCYDWG